MKKIFLLILIILTKTSLASDVFDGTNLKIPVITIGDTTYTNVQVTLGKVISIYGKSVGNSDSYNSSNNQLSIPYVYANNNIYTDVIIEIGKVVSVGSSTNQSVKIFTDITKNSYPTSYANVVSSNNLDDTCLLNADEVQYPSSFKGALDLPVIPAGKSLKTIKLGFTVKDNWEDKLFLPNPNINSGCTTSNRVAFLSTIKRLKALGSTYVQVPQYVCILDTNNPDIDFMNGQVSIPDEDLIWMGQQAKLAGLSIRFTMQICPTDRHHVPLALSSSWANRFFTAYSTFMLNQAKLLDAAEFESMSLDWTDWSPDWTNFADIRTNNLITLSTNIRKVFKGKLWLFDTWSPSTNLLADYIDFQALFISNTFPNLTPTQNATINLSMLKSGLLERLKRSSSLKKPLMLTIQFQSHREYFQLGHIEDSGCWNSSCAANLTTDFSVQALAYEALFEVLADNTLNLNIESLNINSFWLADTLLPHYSFPNTSQSIRNKPAEAIVYNWWK